MNDMGLEPSHENRAARLVAAPSNPAALREPYGHHGGYGPFGAPEPSRDIAYHLTELWRVLNKRKWIVLGVFAAFVALGAVRTLMETPLYTATVRLQIDRSPTKIVEAGNLNTSEGWDYDFLRTQYELLQSRAIAERVASALKLGDEPDFFAARGFSLLGAMRGLLSREPRSAGRSNRGDMEKAAAGIIMGNRSVRPVTGSRLVDVSYSDPNPARAQRIAMAYADAFIASNLDKRFEANAYAKTFLEDQLKQLKLRLEQSEKVLLEFAEREQIVIVTEKSTIAENNLASANAALGQLVSERIKNEQLWKQVESANAINLPQLLTNSVIDGLRARRNALEAEYQEKLETFKPGYPAMVQISNKIAELDRQLAAEVRTLKEAYKNAYLSSLNQENEMKGRIEELKGEVLDLQKRSIQYNILKREVDTNRSLYEGLLQRYKEVDVAGGASANNVFVIDRAEMPGAPSSPRLSRALLISALLGFGAGLGAAFLLDRLDDRIRTAEEMEQVSGLTTLGIIPKIADDDVAAQFADPRSGLSEAYRSLCASLQFSTDNGLPKTLLVTSSGPAEGKSITALAVAKHFATMGLKVLIVDADLRNPSLHLKLSLDNSMGLSNYLTGACAPPEVLQRTDFPNLAFLASGPLPPNAADLLGNSRMLSLLSIGLEVFDLIVIDGPPVMG
ncbi:MAG TPA: polysaccharide biosynthesis tyrosine autokinase, partial [Hyphomicrobiaceae bacterium]|nr:polysaccharide biosynthesis tyrosine autokinase [Hyphomicrobiaceae bacterium]